MPAEAKVLEYVKACLTAGRKMDDIIAELKKAGWASGEIADALEEVIKELEQHDKEKQQAAQPSPQSKPMPQPEEKKTMFNPFAARPTSTQQQLAQPKPAMPQQPQEIAQPKSLIAQPPLQPKPMPVQPSAQIQSTAVQPSSQQPKKLLPWLVEPVAFEKPAVEQKKAPMQPPPTFAQLRAQAAQQASVIQQKPIAPQPQVGMPALKPAEKPGEQATATVPQTSLFPSGEEMLSRQWLSRNWVYLAAVAAVILLVLAILYYYLSPLLAPQ